MLLAVPMASFLQHQHCGPLLLSEIRVEACVQSDALLKGHTTFFFFNWRQTSSFHMCTCPGGAAAGGALVLVVVLLLWGFSCGTKKKLLEASCTFQSLSVPPQQPKTLRASVWR